MKKVSFPLIALLLVFSVLTPSLLSIVDEGSDLLVLTDTNEEEKQGEQEAEKNLDEKDLFLNNFGFTNSSVVQRQKHLHSEFTLFNSNFVVDIHLPPPRTS